MDGILGRAIRWGLIGEVIGVTVSALHLSAPETLLWSTAATILTAIVGSVSV